MNFLSTCLRLDSLEEVNNRLLIMGRSHVYQTAKPRVAGRLLSYTAEADEYSVSHWGPAEKIKILCNTVINNNEKCY